MLFLNNKYTALYYRIITKCQSDIGEVHHIIPKSLGGTNESNNLVRISHKAHFILHRLLIKMVKLESHKVAMNYALFMMMNRNISHYTSRTYDEVRINVSETMKINNPMHDPMVLNKRIGQKRNNETKERMSKANLRRWKTTARPIREFNCPICETHIMTRIPTKTTCSKKCSTTLQGGGRYRSEALSKANTGRKRVYKEDGSYTYTKNRPV